MFRMSSAYYYVYIMTNDHNTVVYTGVTNDLERRVNEHKSGTIEGFTKQYNIKKLVYFEEYTQVKDAIAREKVVKKLSRANKNKLIAANNPDWRDLSLD